MRKLIEIQLNIIQTEHVLRKYNLSEIMCINDVFEEKELVPDILGLLNNSAHVDQEFRSPSSWEISCLIPFKLRAV